MLKIATYNCENLFSRPKVFNASSEVSSKVLAAIDELQKELKKEMFDHEKISALQEEIKGFAFVQNVRGNIQSAKGSKDWFGFVEFYREETDDVSVLNLAKVISDIDADILCLIEVENRVVLQKFHDNFISKKYLIPQNKKPYEHILLVDGNDDRGIDVAVMSRFPIVNIRSHIHEKAKYNNDSIPIFSRDCLEVDLEVNNRMLYLLVNHFKSMGYSNKNDFLSNRRRRMQSDRVSEIISKYDFNSDYVVVAGDLNSTPDSESLEPLILNDGLYNTSLELPEDSRGTYRTGKQQIDYILASNALKQHLKNVYIERRGTYSKKWQTYDTVTSRRNEASDHSAVVAEFEV